MAVGGMAAAEPPTGPALAPVVPPPFSLGEPVNDNGVWTMLNSGGAPAGYVFEIAPLAPLPGFSGAPINALVTLDLGGRFLSVRLLTHNEPIFVSGLGRVLALEGFTDTLINIGEFRAGRPAGPGAGWTIGVADPRHGLVEIRSVAGTALATSSPAALPLAAGRLGHILDPAAPPRPAMWSTVSVEAAAAAEADACSTALTRVDRPGIEAVATADPRLRRVLLVDRFGATAVVRSPRS